MEDVWFNRAGILLNFLAGFLLAPQLIGETRIERLEKALEPLLATYRERFATAKRVLDVNRPITSVLISIGGVLSVVMIAGESGPPPLPAIRSAIVVPALLLFFGMQFIFLLWLLTAALHWLFRLLSAGLAGGDQLITWMVPIGIVCFVLGNALQLIATF